MSERELLGRRVGHIRIVDFLGQGGMGAVYVGFDEKLQRRVALKALHQGKLDTAAQVRLLREARSLSQLRHPHVCQIFDYLEWEGCEYLVLELIEGRGLQEVIASRPDKAHRIRIAEQLVSALAATHARGIIHRDLKPSNVLITTAGDVKVLDFGLARTSAADAVTLHEAGEDVEPPGLDSSVSGVGALMGTLSYMSPEQARGEPLTTASDMFSLGVVLQELFTGQPSYPPGLSWRDQLAKAQIGETLPVTGLDSDLTALINRLKSPVPAVRPSALDTAAQLRWIKEGPRRRFKRLAAISVGILLALVSLSMTYQALRIRQEANRANREAGAAREVSEFLVKLFEVSDPGESRGNTVTARELLDKGSKEIEGRLQDQPLVKARLQHTIARVYSELGLLKDAESLAKRAIDLRRSAGDEVAAASGLSFLGSVLVELGQYAEAEAVLHDARDLQSRLLPDDSLDLAETLTNLGNLHMFRAEYNEGVPLLERALEIRRRRLGPDHPDVGETLNDLAAMLYEKGEPAEAEVLYRQAVAIWEKALGPDHPWVAIGLSNVANACDGLRKYSEAEELYQRSLAIRERVLGPSHYQTVSALRGLAVVHIRQGKYDQAETLLKRALTTLEKSARQSHPEYAVTLWWLAQVYRDRGSCERAEPLYMRALTILEESLGSDHPDVARGYYLLGLCLQALGRTHEAKPPLLRALEIDRASASGPGVVSGRSLLVLARLFAVAGLDKEAEDLYRRSLEVLEKTLGPKDLELADELSELASWLRRKGREEEASALLTKALEVERSAAPTGFRDQSEKIRGASILIRAGRVAEARPIAREVLATGYREPAFVGLCMESGVLEESSERR